MDTGSERPNPGYFNQELLLPPIQALDQELEGDGGAYSESLGYRSMVEFNNTPFNEIFSYQGYTYEHSNPYNILPPLPPTLPRRQNQELDDPPSLQRRSSVDSARLNIRSKDIPIPSKMRRSSIDSAYIVNEVQEPARTLSNSVGSTTSLPERKKRAQVKRACGIMNSLVQCRKVSKKCSETRPCERCRLKGLVCYDVARKQRRDSMVPADFESCQSWQSESSLDQHMNRLGIEPPVIHSQIESQYYIEQPLVDPHDLLHVDQLPSGYHQDSYCHEYSYGFTQSQECSQPYGKHTYLDNDDVFREEMLLASLRHYAKDS